MFDNEAKIFRKSAENIYNDLLALLESNFHN